MLKLDGNGPALLILRTFFLPFTTGTWKRHELASRERLFTSNSAFCPKIRPRFLNLLITSGLCGKLRGPHYDLNGQRCAHMVRMALSSLRRYLGPPSWGISSRRGPLSDLSQRADLLFNNELTSIDRPTVERPTPADHRSSESPFSVPREMLRLAYVIDRIEDWNLGGTETQLARMVKVLDRRIFEPVIFVLQASQGAKAKDLGCPVLVLNEANNKSRVRSFRNLQTALKRFQPHIVQTFFIDGIFYGTLAAWFNGVPVIVQSRRNAGYWQKCRHALALRAVNLAVDSWQCNSRWVARVIQGTENVPADRIKVLHNSIDTDHFSPAMADERLAVRQSLGLPLEAPVFVAVATFRPVKGLLTILEAAAKLRPRLPQAQFLIVGRGPQQEELAKEIAQKDLHETVRLVGAHSDVRPWLAAADVGILASFSESSSNALLEYMSMGLPAVLSDIPANRELVPRISPRYSLPL